ncbi:sodium:proton antiporter [Desulfosporosinus sp. OT]|uniref:cation:proton antiporter n=1 Tax=Desulfosporosinus sp. OT TaxID=913865 RepID=UPI000223A8BF|nr:sodium:proton antiporter [Desulfosporosinus sp. OT]EGW40460.1 sodium/hydrogen exchanger family protein [Desulfosporosinus sp. OT]
MVYILWLFVMALAGTALAKKMKFPYPIALVLLGTSVGTFSIFNELKLHFMDEDVFRNIVIDIFLPALIGEASLKLSFRKIRENSRAILSLAIGGTLISYLTTGLLIAYLLHWPIQVALVFGALMSATDPVSIVSIFKSLGVNKDLEITMEGESLANDGVAIVLFKLTVFSYAMITSSGWMGIGFGIYEFLKVSLGGALVGGVFGFIASRVVSHFDDYPLENSFSIALFYGTYFLSESLHFSGVIAIVAAGLVLGNYGRSIGMSEKTQQSIEVFWDTIAFIGNSLIFYLVGLEIQQISINQYWGYIIIAIGVAIISRSIAVYLSTMGTKLPTSWKHILNWGGLKGSLSIALAMSLPSNFPQREAIVGLIFGVVFFSLVGQGLTIGRLIKRMPNVGIQKVK